MAPGTLCFSFNQLQYYSNSLLGVDLSQVASLTGFRKNAKNIEITNHCEYLQTGQATKIALTPKQYLFQRFANFCFLNTQRVHEAR